MAAGTLGVTVRDYKGKTAVVKVNSSDATIAKAEAFAAFIASHSVAQVIGCGVNLGYTDDPADNGKYDRVLQSMTTLWFKADGSPLRCSIPAPLDADVNEAQEMDSDVAEDFKDALIAAGASASLVYNGSGLKSRTPGKGERDTTLTGV
jgi:hypothetical protein